MKKIVTFSANVVECKITITKEFIHKDGINEMKDPHCSDVNEFHLTNTHRILLFYFGVKVEGKVNLAN